MSRPFRFGLHFWRLPSGDWAERVRHYEALGFSTITFTDHVVVPQADPLVAAASVSAASATVHAGSLVLDMGLRNPVLVAKAAATIHDMSGGRFELGVGAGYLKANFDAAGVPWPRAAARLARLEESIQIIRSIWVEETMSVSSEHFQLEDVPRALPDPIDMPILVGGGGPKAMALAGRHADIVSLIPRQPNGEWSVPDSLEDSTDDKLAEKVGWVRDAAERAGRDPDVLELNTMVFRTSIGDDVRARREQVAALDSIDPDATIDSSLYLTGTVTEVHDRLLARRDRCGVSYYSFFDPGDDQVEVLADVLRTLA
jgi:probable F420-dependent oxidoreductase